MVAMRNASDNANNWMRDLTLVQQGPPGEHHRRTTDIVGGVEALAAGRRPWPRGSWKVSQVIGTVVDVEFPADQLPGIYEAAEIEMGSEIIVEVQQHRVTWVRCLAMDSTDGLARGVKVVSTGSPITIPVGEATLGRLFNVLGEGIDNLGEVKSDEHWPIHRPAPTLDERETSPQVLETGIKVLDLVSPFTKGGKVGAYVARAQGRQSSSRS
jgi:F-type H+-transporting ATPase subunit beta